MMAQNLPFSEIPIPPNSLNGNTSISRLIEGLGFRYYWATEGLLETDLNYRPTPEAQSTLETLSHIYSLSEVIKKTIEGQIVDRSSSSIPTTFEYLRKETLENLQVATQILRRMQKKELKELKIRFLREGQTTEFAIWNLINGPISDAIYHTGQVVSFRRTAGNPIPKGVNVFLGIKQ